MASPCLNHPQIVRALHLVLERNGIAVLSHGVKGEPHTKKEKPVPFDERFIRPFNRDAIERLTPNQLGVYGIYRDGLWIYIGQGDLRTRLLAHLNGDNPCILLNGPTKFVAELAADPVAREKELLREIITTCNQRIG